MLHEHLYICALDESGDEFLGEFSDFLFVGACSSKNTVANNS
jgi:hypothetical protein